MWSRFVDAGFLSRLLLVVDVELAGSRRGVRWPLLAVDPPLVMAAVEVFESRPPTSNTGVVPEDSCSGDTRLGKALVKFFGFGHATFGTNAKLPAGVLVRR